MFCVAMMEEALAFHEDTNHTPESVWRRTRGLDWRNQPHPFKEYLDLPHIGLPAPGTDAGIPLVEALRRALPSDEARLPALTDLAHLLYYSAGVTRVQVGRGGNRFYFRAYACAGALYPIEVYLVAADVPGLLAGVYHFHPRDFVLRPLRQGDHRDHLLAAAAGDPAIARAPVTLVLSALYWRTTWKYEARGYRHLYWDSGMILANLFALTAAMHIPAKLVLGFVDDEIDRLLGLDGEHEVSLALVPLGIGPPVKMGSDTLERIQHAVAPLSRRELEYPEIHVVHEASRLDSPATVQAWRSADASSAPSGHLADGIGLSPEAHASTVSVERVIVRRGSTRLFSRESITFGALSTVLDQAVYSPIAADFHDTQTVNEPYVIVNAVDNLTSGAYVMDPSTQTVHLLRPGNFRDQAAFLCLEQPLAGDAACVVFLMADLESAIARLGNRGYRAVLLQAGILGGRMYLAAYAQKIGASGLTFYDGEVARFFSPHATGKRPMLAIAIGRDARRFRRG